MKKAISVFLIFIFLLSSFSISAFASSDKLTLEEAKDIIWESFLFTNQVRNSPKLNYDKQYIREGAAFGEKPYYEVLEFPGGSYEAMKEYAGRIYSDSIAKYSYTYSQYTNGPDDPNIYPLFIFAEDGTIYGGKDEIIQYAWAWLSLDGKAPGEVFRFVTRSTDKYNADKLLVEMVESTESTATVKVCFQLGSETKERIHWADCNFVKEDGVWKISGGEYFDLFNGSYREASPSTGDSAAERATLLGAVSLACLIPAACLTIKRRRTVVF